MRAGYLLQGLGLALTPIAALLAAPPLVTLFVASTFYALGAAVSSPTVNSLCSQLVPDARQGELFGILHGCRSIGFVVGPILGGILYDWRPGFPYYMAGMVCILAALLVPRKT